MRPSCIIGFARFDPYKIDLNINKSDRRYDIDTWRLIAILMVYLHHVCMPFNGDDFHIMNEQSSKLLDDTMVFFEQFRLPLLFFISGVGTMYAFSKRTWFGFVRERSYRLVIPFIFGVLFIVPPQTYFENKSEFNSYFDFYSQILSNLEANHLWFIENLYWMSLIIIPLVLVLKSSKGDILKKEENDFTHGKWSMLLWAVPLIILKIVTKRYFPESSKDITNLSTSMFYGYFFLAGILIVHFDNLWQQLINYRQFHFKLIFFFTVLFYGYYFLPNEIAANYLSLQSRWDLWYGISSLLSWTGVITLLGYGQIWFQKGRKMLSLLNEGIYPFYILHQTVIVVFSYFIVQFEAGIFIKILILLFTSFPTILLLYRYLVYPFKVTRVLFGMKKRA